MSTIKVNNIQDTSAANSSTPAEIHSGRAKAWVNFNGVGTVAIRDDYNVASITDNSTGNYFVNYTNDLDGSNYVITGSSGGTSNTTNGAIYLVDQSTARTAAKCRIYIGSTNGAAVDCDMINIVMFD
jgi:hypothetical protein